MVEERARYIQERNRMSINMEGSSMPLELCESVRSGKREEEA
jgi:hypothetical protein